MTSKPSTASVEDEFFDRESFASRGDFLAKAGIYNLCFNLVRSNSSKQNLSAWQILDLPPSSFSPPTLPAATIPF
jgi:hypothetical protein